MKTKTSNQARYCPFSSIVTTRSFCAAMVLAILPPLLAQGADSCVPQPSGLVGWWSGNGDAQDRTGVNPGTVQGGLTFEAGRVAQAFSLHGGTDAVKISASASLDVGSGSGLTIEAWINPRDIANRCPLVEWNREGTTATEWGAQLWVLREGDFGLPAGSLFANLAEANGTPHYIYSPGGTISTGVWQHVAVTYDKVSGRAVLYLNGAIVADLNLGVFNPETSWNLFLGRRPAGDGTVSYNGLLDEVSIYNRTLSATEIQGIYNAASAGKCANNPGQNQTPTISNIPDQSTPVNTPTAAIPLSINDAETPADSLTLTAGSSNPTLVPTNNVVFGGSGSNRTVTVTPAANQTGNATITVTVSDGTNNASDNFLLVVGNASPTIDPIAPQTVYVDHPALVILNAGDAETPVPNLQLSLTSSDPSLIRPENVVFHYFIFDGHWYITVVPTFGLTGTATNTVTVSDGHNSASADFVLTVSPPPPGSARFVNADAVTIAEEGAATPYPSTINVTGMSGTITNLTLTLSKLHHQWIKDVHMLLVGPTGQGMVVFSRVSDGAVTNITATLTDAAPFVLPESFDLWSEQFKPTDWATTNGSYSDNNFPAPAPGGPYGPVNFANSFNGLAANGTWSLYVYDDHAPASGGIAGGWSLMIGTAGAGGGNSPPAISDIPNQSTPVNTPTAAIPFSINDAETAADSLTLTADSSNPTLVPTNNVVFGGSGSNRTVTVTPAANQTGNATITVTVSDGTNNASDSFTLTVNGGNGGVLTVTVTNATRMYGETNPVFTGSLTGLQNGDNITASYTSTATPASPVGQYAITPVFSDPDGKLGNYTVVTNPGTLTVSPAALSVSAADKSRTYGAANPALTGSLVGIQNGDNITASYTTTANAASAVGTYPITPALSDPDGKLGNYNVTAHNGTLTVNPAPLSVSAADKGRTYGAANPALTGSLVGIQNGDNITASYTTPANAASAVGTYPITPALSDPDGRLGNYNVTAHNGTLTVNPAPLSVRADDKSRAFAAPNPPLTGTITGIQNQDNITATYSTTANMLSLPGDYPITPALEDPDTKLGNYSVSIFNGTLTVMLLPAPTIACEPDRMVELGTDWDFNPPTATGSNLTVTVLNTTTNLECGDAYSATRSWMVTDAVGLQATCSQTIRVADTRPPVIVCAPDKTQPYGAVWTFDAPIARDAGVVDQLVYDNSVNDLLYRFDPGSLEVGDEIILDGAARHLSRFSFEFWGTNAAGGDFQGNVQARVRFYRNDGPLSDSDYATPGTVIFDSGGFAIPAVPRATVLFEDFQVDAVVPLVEALPDAFTWTVQFSGLSSNDSAGLDLYSPPVVGLTYQDYWELDGGQWQLKTNAVASMDFAARFEAVSRGVTMTTLGTVTNDAGCGNSFTATRTWQAADACSNAVTCSQTVTVRDTNRPVIVSQPADQVVLAGGTAVFSVSADGCPPLSYRWVANGTNILAGATNAVLILINVASGQAGLYMAVVSNANGAVTSLPAHLTVAESLRITQQPQNQTVLRGGSAQFHVTAEGAPSPTFQWYRDCTNPIPAATQATLTLTNVTFADGGNYCVAVSNALGIITSQPAVLRVLAAPDFVSISSAGSAVSVTFSTVSGLLYTVQYNDTLGPTGWLPLQNSFQLVGSGVPLTIPDPDISQPQRFYRILVE